MFMIYYTHPCQIEVADSSRLPLEGKVPTSREEETQLNTALPALEGTYPTPWVTIDDTGVTPKVSGSITGIGLTKIKGAKQVGERIAHYFSNLEVITSDLFILEIVRCLVIDVHQTHNNGD